MVDAARRHRLLGRPLRPEVGHRRAGAGPQGAHQHDAPDAALARGLDEVAGAGGHHALEGRRRALDDRDEVHDGAHSALRDPQRRRVRDVAPHELAVDAVEYRGAAGGANHGPHVRAASREVTHDVTADEPARSGDEDHPPSAKFCQ